MTDDYEKIMEGGGISFFSRVGGKQKVAKQIIKMFPKEYNTFIEPFLGGGKVFLELEQRPNVKYVLGEKNKDIYYLWKDVKTINADIIRSFNFSSSTREQFNRMLQHTNIKDPVDRLFRNLYVSFFSYSGNRRNYISKRSSKGQTFLKSIDKLKDKLKNVILLNKDYKQVIKQYDNPNAIIYLDPPYFNFETYYEKQAIDPLELAEVCRGIKGKFILSYNIHPEVTKAFKDFNIHTLQVPYSVGHEKYIKKEYLITNF